MWHTGQLLTTLWNVEPHCPSVFDSKGCTLTLTVDLNIKCYTIIAASILYISLCGRNCEKCFNVSWAFFTFSSSWTVTCTVWTHTPSYFSKLRYYHREKRKVLTSSVLMISAIYLCESLYEGGLNFAHYSLPSSGSGRPMGRILKKHTQG